MKWTTYTFIIAIFMTAVNTASAQFLIDENCAINSLGGCFPGDNPGYPVTISSPGTYRLTSNLTTTQTATNIINIESNDVTIDLNGFSLIGPLTCSGPTPTCTPASNPLGDGIKTTNTRSNITIKNGIISGLGGSGIQLTAGNNHTVHDVIIDQNGSNGIVIDQDGIIRQSSVTNNGGIGIISGANSLIQNNNVYNNFSAGITGGICGNNIFQSNNSSLQPPPQEFCTFLSSTNICGPAGLICI